MLNIPILLATGRNERKSENVAKFVLSKAVEFGFDSQIVDVRDHMTDRTIPSWQEPGASKKWSEIMNHADGLIIVTPEYNHSFPGELKIVLDQLYKEYEKKPVSICSVSSGIHGGLRVVESLWNVLIELSLVPNPKAINFGDIKNLFDDKGEIKNEKYIEYVENMLNQMDWYAKTLKYGRENFS